jgi:transglutaminase-like putative cysteine protease
MDTAAKVLIGVAVGTAGILGVAALVARRQGLGGDVHDLEENAEMPTPIAVSKSPDGTTVRVFSKKKLPIKERLAIIQDLIAKGTSGPDLPKMRALALQITRGCPARDDKCEAKAIYDWVRRNVRYTGDIAPHKVGGRKGPVESVDLFQTAKQTADMGGGDCDDHTTLVATLAILNGIQARLRVTSPYKWGDDNFTHIYPVVGLPKNDPSKWVTVDTTLPGDRFGVEVGYSKSLDVMA